jgi:hypothetical protein
MGIGMRLTVDDVVVITSCSYWEGGCERGSQSELTVFTKLLSRLTVEKTRPQSSGYSNALILSLTF